MGNVVDSDFTLQQPPPDSPPPAAPGFEARYSRTRARMIFWLGLFSFVGCVIFLGLPLMIRHSHKHGHRSQAIHNIKHVGIYLWEFESEYGKFPDASTIPAVQAATGTKLPLGTTSSNQIFRQCLAGGGGRSEHPFWAKTAISPTSPDDVFITDATALAKGECGFAYIAGLKPSDDPTTPIVMTPLIPGTLTFDPKPFDGKAIILSIDNGARPYPIDKHGRVMINGMDLFDPKQPFWKGRAPDVKWPE